MQTESLTLRRCLLYVVDFGIDQVSVWVREEFLRKSMAFLSALNHTLNNLTFRLWFEIVVPSAIVGVARDEHGGLIDDLWPDLWSASLACGTLDVGGSPFNQGLLHVVSFSALFIVIKEVRGWGGVYSLILHIDFGDIMFLFKQPFILLSAHCGTELDRLAVD